MQHCPHCGAELGENARFCPYCMTSLIKKQVIPTPKYFPVRWLFPIAAVFLLCGGVWGGLHLWPQEAQNAILQSTTTTVTAVTPATTTATTITTAPITTLPQTTTAEDITTTAENITTTTEDITTTVPTTTATTTATTVPATTQTTAATTTAISSTTTTKPTTTTKKTTTTTRATYPSSWDVPAVFYTEDGEVFEDVGWTYRSAGNSIRVANSGFAEYNTFTKTCLYNIPLSECIIITGFTKPAANGCYRIPPTIDGKVVVAIDMQQPVDGAYQFNDEGVAPTVRIITFPPEMIVVYPYTFDRCQNMEHAYFTSAQLLMYPSAVPTDTGYTYADSLAMHAYRTRMLYDPYAGEYEVLKNYCQYIVDPGVCITNGRRKHYPNVYWWPTDTAFFSQLYPDWFTDKHNEW